MRNLRVSTRQTQASTTFQLRLDHPMESGLRSDASGNIVPAWYLTHLDVFLNEKPISTIELGPNVSRNPALSFALKGIETGDEVVIKWFDSRDESGERKTIV